MSTPEKELLATARKLANLQVKQRKLRAALKLVAGDIRHERKMLKALASVSRMQSAPSRAFGNGVGHTLPKVKSTRKPFNGDRSVEEFVNGLSAEDVNQ